MGTKRGLNLIKAVNDGELIDDMKLRVVDYARVSTSSMEQKKSFQNQLETYRDMIESNPNWTYEGTYSDEGVTGTKVALRGGFQQMMADAKRGMFDLIIVKDVPRFARNIKECLVYKDKLKSYGVMIWFVREKINSFRDSDQMMLQFMAIGAEMEAKSARERTRLVFQQGIQKGKVYGNSKILGYTKEGCKLVIDEQEAEIVRQIFDLYVHQRLGLRTIAKRLSEQGLTRSSGTAIAVPTIKSVLENPKYKGYYCGGKTEMLESGDKYIRNLLPQDEWVMYKDPDIPAIVSESLWDAAARIRQERYNKYRHEVSAPCNQGIYRYSGKIESNIVPGLRYQRVLYRYKGAVRESWACRNYKDLEKPGTVGPTLYSDELDDILTSILRDLVGSYDSIVEDLLEVYRQNLTDDGQGGLERLQQKLAEFERKKARLMGLYEDELISKEDFQQRMQQHQTEIAKLSAQIQEREQEKLSTQQFAKNLNLLKENIVAVLEEGVPSKETIDTLVDKIVVCPDSTKTEIHIEVHLKLIPTVNHYIISRGKKDKSEDSSSVLCGRCTFMYR